MKTIAIDIKHSVFDNETEAIMYVTKDNEAVEDIYIFAVPIITFCWSALNEDELNRYFPHVFGDKDKENRLKAEMKRAIRLLQGTE